MYSIDFDKNLIKDVKLVEIKLLNPHEKVIEKKKSSLAKFIKSYENYYIISSIVCCHKSMLIIDGHHRYTALKELGVKKIPVTLINYSNKDIRTTDNNSILKEDLIRNAKKNKLYSPKSTKHSVFCNQSKLWSPITLLSTLFELRINITNN